MTSFISLLWAFPNQRRPLRITSSARSVQAVTCLTFLRFANDPRPDTPRIPRRILLMFAFIAQHSLTYVRAGLVMASYTFDFIPRGMFLSYNIGANLMYHRSQVGLLETSTLYSPFSVICAEFSRVHRSSIFATLIPIPMSDKTFRYDSSPFFGD